RLFLAIVFAFGSQTLIAVAQEASLEELSIGASGEAYLRSIRFRGIDSDVAYFDPSRPAPDLTTSETPGAEPEGRDAADGLVEVTPRSTQIITIVITGLVMAVVVYLFVKFGGAGSISFGRSPENAARAQHQHAARTEDGSGTPANLQAILRMSDRSEALVALSKYLLAHVIAAQGVLLQRSWTARDAMRRVPRDFSHRDALYRLVLASERVQFGGRHISEDEFSDHLAEVKPLFSGAKA
ncbi:MAG: DUF4129 domain-containing protein, partial [Pseudomonadota bacterium]